MGEIRIVQPAQIAAALGDLWSPRVIGELDDNYIKVARVQGEFVRHSHSDEDELFFILKGSLRIEFDDAEVVLHEGDLFIIPKGVPHRPVASEECHILLIERKTTAHTGDVDSPLTRSIDEQIAQDAS